MHNDVTTLQVTLECGSGDITFYRKVSSESNYDSLEFHTDFARTVYVSMGASKPSSNVRVKTSQ